MSLKLKAGSDNLTNHLSALANYYNYRGFTDVPHEIIQHSSLYAIEAYRKYKAEAEEAEIKWKDEETQVTKVYPRLFSELMKVNSVNYS